MSGLGCVGWVTDRCHTAISELAGLGVCRLQGRITGVTSRGVEIAGLAEHLSLGERISLTTRAGDDIRAEVIGFRNGGILALTFGSTEGLGVGGVATTTLGRGTAGLPICDEWLGRVVDPLGRPLDGCGALRRGLKSRNTRSAAPDATLRARLGSQLDLGVKALNVFTPCRVGQRLGLFAGSGVGKSTLLSMLTRNAGCDVAVLALVGERGREVREFLEDDLGKAGLEKSVVVVATSDHMPLMRREAAYAAITIAEYFRDAGKTVLLLMDSVTRFCLALREIALAAGEPPATRGYPPSVFAELPRLLERAGPGPRSNPGSISAFFTVLVEGDDHNEPVADAVRGILDGHVILDRQVGERGRYPAIDVLRSLSRTAATCYTDPQAKLAKRARGIMSLYADSSELVRLGAYERGSDPSVDEALAFYPKLERALQQARDQSFSIAESFSAVEAAVGCA